MKAWRAAVAMTAVLGVSSAWAATDNAKEKGGGGSSSAGGRHHSGSNSGSSKGAGSPKASSGSSSSSSSSSAGESSASRRTPTGAQLRHPRAGTGTGFNDRRYRGSRYYGGRYGGYYGYGYDPFWSGFYGYSWYSPFYYGGYSGGGYYGGYQPYPHRYGYSSYRAGAVRVLVNPNEARVYVDGYYAGIADDFDGIFQRLNLAPGRHDISLKLEGYRTHNVKLYVPYDGTIKLHHRMARGTGEEDAGVVGRPEDYARFEERGDPDDGRDYEDERDERDRRSDQAGDRALVRLDVRPGDASVYVDGAFRGTGRELRQLRLTAGRHRIEVVRPGYRTIDREVDVRGGQTLDVDIDLDRS